MLIIGTARGIGLASVQTFEVQTFCEFVIILSLGSFDVFIDLSTSLSAFYGVGDLYIFDIKAGSGCSGKNESVVFFYRNKSPQEVPLVYSEMGHYIF